jgi:hypothetical protein
MWQDFVFPSESHTVYISKLTEYILKLNPVDRDPFVVQLVFCHGKLGFDSVAKLEHET